MQILETDIERAALLHDIGKLYRRAGYGRETHSKIGQRILKPFFDGDKDFILRAVAYHHKDPLKAAALPADDISYLIYEADNLAAGVDRRTIEDGEAGFREHTPLGNIFNTFDKPADLTAYALQGFHEKTAYPQEKSTLQAAKPQYQRLAAQLNDAFKVCSPADMTLSELLQLLEDTMAFVPSSTKGDESADITLYDHQKLTAAFAACLYYFFQEKHITDYKTYCYGNKVKNVRQASAYLIVAGNLSGISGFVYNIPSKGALKSLRGRSLYIDLLLQNIVDEILTACGVSRSCLLYAGGGHFYLLLPNTERVKKTLQTYHQRLDDWFLRYYGSRLYLALSYTPCSSEEFKDKGKGTQNVFYRANQKNFQDNQCRYQEEQLQALFNPESQYNRLLDSMRECAICHTSAVALKPYRNEEGVLACDSCNNLYHLGEEALLRSLFAIYDQPSADWLPLPGYEKELYLQAVSPEQLDSLPEPRRLYVKNKLSLGSKVATAIWLGDYVTADNTGKILEFSDLAASAAGISRLGLLYADVDNLQAAFQAGFSQHFDTLSRKAVFSKAVSLFFTTYINDLCRKFAQHKGEGPVLFKGEKEQPRRFHIIYSGGDSLCMIGAWDDILEFSLLLRQVFSVFTNHKLTLSAGIGFFKPGFPVSRMVQKTRELEKYAKENFAKNSVALFGEVVEYGPYQDNVMTARYTWDELEQGVIQDKICFLENHFTAPGKKDPRKLIAGKGLLYRLLDLMRHSEQVKGNINLARFAYVLARMEPKKNESKEKMACYQDVRRQLYNWYQSEKDRQQLITAIELLVYHTRL